MQNDRRDRLVEIIMTAEGCNQPEEDCPYDFVFDCTACLCRRIADHLIANGVIVLDTNVISPENRPLITHFANMPLDDVFELIKNKEDVVPVVRKSVKGYEGYYEVDQFGRVFSVDRVISVNDNGRQYNKPLKAKQMKQHIHTNGYKVVSLTKDGKSKGLFVHRIVAEAFIENPNNLPMVNHKDEDKTNNFVENLEWCTVAYNNTYGNAQKKRIKKIKGVPHTEEHKEKISSSLKRYYKQNPIMKFEYKGRMLSIPELSEELNIPQETLRARYRRTGSVFLCSYGERKNDDGKM